MKILRSCKWLLGFCVVSVCVYGQLYVDDGGPRNIFVASSDAKDAKFFSLDSKTESISLNFLQLEQNPVGGWLFGGTVTGSSPNNDVMDIFKNQAPTVTGSVLANWTDYELPNVYPGNIVSATFKASNAYASYAMEDPTTSKDTTDKVDEPLASVALAWAFSGNGTGLVQNAFCLTLGITKGDNYQSLPQKSETNGKTVRVGVLQTFTSFPTQLLFVREFAVDSGSALDKAITFASQWSGGSSDSTATVERFIELSPYVSYSPRDGGSSSSGFGLNIALKTHQKAVKASEGKPAQPGKLAFPWSFYVESTKKYGLSTYTTGAGVSTIFSF